MLTIISVGGLVGIAIVLAYMDWHKHEHDDYKE